MLTNEHLSFLGGLTEPLRYYSNAKDAAVDFFCQNLVATPENERRKDFVFSVVSPEQFTCDEITQALVDFQEACDHHPTWSRSPAKHATDALLARIATTHHKELHPDGVELQFKPDEKVTLTQMVRNAAAPFFRLP